MVGHVVLMKKMPELFCKPEEEGWVVGFKKDGIECSMYADSKKEAYAAFWDYLYAYIPCLEEEENMVIHLVEERNLLREFFHYEKLSFV